MEQEPAASPGPGRTASRQPRLGRAAVVQAFLCHAAGELGGTQRSGTGSGVGCRRRCGRGPGCARFGTGRVSGQRQTGRVGQVPGLERLQPDSRGPVRRVSPRISSSPVPNSSGPERSCASWKKVASTQPVPSSTLMKTTRRPPRMGGVWVATRIPATSTSRSVAQAQQILGRRDAQFCQQRRVAFHQVGADVERQQVQFGAHHVYRRRVPAGPGPDCRSSRSPSGRDSWPSMGS